MKKLLISLTILVSALISGCASTHVSPSQTFRPKGSDRLLAIHGEILREEGFETRHKLKLTIDGKTAIDSDIGNGNSDVSGQLDGKPVQALCNRQDIGRRSYNIHCRIIIDGEFASTLTF